jgi:hypothetical protein
VLVAQDKPEVTVFRRSNHWQPEVIKGRDDPLRLGFALSLRAIYDGIKL